MGGIFGGSKSKSTSSNQGFDFLKQQFGGLTDMATSGANAFQQLMGGDASGFNAFKKATGFDATAEQGSRGITGNAAAGGMLRSGGTGKALQSFGNNLQNTFSNDYLKNLGTQAGFGFNAGQLIGSAGQKSEATEKKKNGIGGLLGTIMSGGAAG